MQKSEKKNEEQNKAKENTQGNTELASPCKIKHIHRKKNKGWNVTRYLFDKNKPKHTLFYMQA